MVKWLSYQRNRTVVFFFFGITFSVYSQGNIYDELNSQYKRLIQEQQLDSALIFAKQMNSWALKNEGDTSLRFAVSFRCIGNCLQGNISDSSLIFYKKSVSILSNQGRKIHLESANGNFNIGLYYDKKGDYSNAKFYYLKSIEIKDSILGRENLDYALTLLQIANINFNLSNYNQASVQYQEILNTRIKLLGENSLNVADVLFNLGLLNSKTSNNKDAISYFLKTLTGQFY
jgi:tetratricopeptide (TPR) repeat protein